MNTKSKKRKTTATSFKKGNKIHELAENPGRPLRYTPEHLRVEFDKYTKHIDANPWMRAEIVKEKDGAYLMDVPVKRPYTLMGFCLHIDLQRKVFYEYVTRPEFSNVTAYILDAVYQQKFEGAASGWFNSNIISRDLGLVDKAVTENINVAVTPSADEAREIKKALLKKI